MLIFHACFSFLFLLRIVLLCEPMGFEDLRDKFRVHFREHDSNGADTEESC